MIMLMKVFKVLLVKKKVQENLLMMFLKNLFIMLKIVRNLKIKKMKMKTKMKMKMKTKMKKMKNQKKVKQKVWKKII